LGQASFHDGEKNYWNDQMKINPMVLTAPVREPKGNESNPKERRIEEDIELRFYVCLRAINELVRNKTNGM